MERHINKFVAVWALALTAFLVMGLTVPNSFTAGNTISSAEMNANFAAVKAAVDAFEAQRTVVGSARVFSSGGVADGYMANGNTPMIMHPTTGVYVITWPGDPFDFSARTALVELVAVPGSTSINSSGGDLIVSTYNAAGVLADAQFRVVIFND